MMANQTTIVLWNLANNTNLLINVPGSVQFPRVSEKGEWIVFESANALSTNTMNQIYVYDVIRASTDLISVNVDGIGGGNGDSWTPQISPDGRYVIFQSQASNLIPNDKNGLRDVFARNLETKQTICLSMNMDGTGSGNGFSGNPVLLRDGRTVVFQSWAYDLIPGDFNYSADIFMARLASSSGASDTDAMDDNWEIRYFGDLNQGNDGDHDGDGMSNLSEYLAGTNPTDKESYLRIVMARIIPGAEISIQWTAIIGKTYRVQYKDSLSSTEWTNFSGDVLAVSTIVEKADNTPMTSSQRFYRVILVH